jgi:prepilin-type N-terminal cleavage/methylation domain-containing protein
MNPMRPMSSSRRGFTLVEMMFAMVLSSLLAGAALSAILSHSRSVTRMEATVRQLEQVRLTSDLLATEIGDLTRNSMLFARGDSLSFRLPIAWGVVCGELSRATAKTGKVKKLKDGTIIQPPRDTNGAVFFEQPATALGAPVPEGFGMSANGKDWSYFNTASWSGLHITNDTVARTACLDVVPVTVKLKKGEVPPPPPPPVPGLITDFWKFPYMKGQIGAVIPERAVFSAFIKISYFLKAEPTGGLALYRHIGNVDQKLAWPFSANAGFRYSLADGTQHSTVAAGDLANIRRIKTILPALKVSNPRWQADSMQIAPWMPLYNAR